MKDPADKDTVDLYGVDENGIQVHLGKVRIPLKMKAREIVASYFGRIDEESGDDGAMALWAINEFIDWLEATNKDVRSN